MVLITSLTGHKTQAFQQAPPPPEHVDLYLIIQAEVTLWPGSRTGYALPITQPSLQTKN